MKKHKKTLAVFLCGMLFGALIMGGSMKLFRQASLQPVNIGQTEETTEDTEAIGESTGAAAEDSASAEKDTEVTPPAAEETEETTAERTEDSWDAEAVYVGGDEVSYGGKIYRAKWWTQGEEPGRADVWEDTLVAAGQMVVPSEDAAEDAAEERESESTLPEEVGKREDFKVVGYFPSWKENIDVIQYDVLTHINYAFAIPTAEGGLLPLENPQLAQKIIEAAHDNGVKVFLAVGGWSYHEVPLESTFVSATETEEKRTALADEIIAMCDEYGFDGVDLDWEHPRVDGDSSKQYEALVLALEERLHEQDKQLSSAVLSGVTADGNVYYDSAAHTDKVLEAVDWINVMAYDGGDGERHSAYDFAVNCGTYWNEMRGMPADKVVLGVPFYARPSWASYSDILSAVPDAWSMDHTDYNGMDVWYNGVSTIEDKTSYALGHLGGIMIWEISQDASGEHSLQTAIGKTVKDYKKHE